jgi:epoxyqueuosine reductase QueG
VAPTHTSLFRTIREGAPRPPVSTWSERHALYAAGLGTFSLNDGFITPRGIAMRCGSVVTDLPLLPTPRPYASHTANCLFLSQGTCSACISRCPVGAISPQGHDKALCAAYLDTVSRTTPTDADGHLWLLPLPNGCAL